jgi:hypothetical protein
VRQHRGKRTQNSWLLLVWNYPRSSSGSGWQTLSSSVVSSDRPSGRTLADIKKEEEESASASAPLSKGVHKRKAEDDEDVRDEEAAPKRKIWGNTLKTYPGGRTEDVDEDLDALLSGVAKKPTQPSSSTVDEGATGQAEVIVDAGGEVKSEPTTQTSISGEVIKEEEPNESAVTAPPPVVFKKRKAKR